MCLKEGKLETAKDRDKKMYPQRPFTNDFAEGCLGALRLPASFLKSQEITWTSSLVLLKCSMHQSHLEVLLKCRFLGLASRVPNSVGLCWDPRICIFNNAPSDVNAAASSVITF